MSEPGRHRYPGPDSFGDTDLDRALFQGRGSEGNRLVHLTLAEDIVVLYAKSGTGKTSLINTKLLQPLRERQFLPVVARIGDDRFTPADAICDAVRDAARERGYELHDGDRTSLLAYFRTLEVWNKDVLLTPVVILDQFEELFTVRTPEDRDAFARELAALRGRIDPGPDQAGLGEGHAPVKLVLSLREDSIGELEELAVSMPEVLRHRFRIGPLSEGEARAAIDEPAKLTDPTLSTPPFEWKKETVDRLIKFLHLRRRAGRVFTTSHVEPFQLQLICRHVEELVAKRHSAGQTLDPIDYDKDIGGDAGAQRIMRGFYEEQISALATEYPIKRLRKLCEEGLITTAGRRAILDESTIADKYKLDAKALEALTRGHLIRVEPRGDEKRYELSHDTLVAPIVEVREARRARRNVRVRAGALAAVAVLGIAGFFGARSDAYQVWQALREWQAVETELRGTTDSVKSAWSLALGWAGAAEGARDAAETIEHPPTRVVALTRLAQALAALGADANRPIVEETLSRAIGIAKRVQDPAERAQRLVGVASAAEALKLDMLAGEAWSGVGIDANPDTWAQIIDEAENRRNDGTPLTPGLDAALNRLTAIVADELIRWSNSFQPAINDADSSDELGTLAAAARLVESGPPAVAERLSATLGEVAVKLPPALQRDVLIFVALDLINRESCDRALPFLDRAERLLQPVSIATGLHAFALLAHLFEGCGRTAHAAVMAERLVSTAARESSRESASSLMQALHTLEGRFDPYTRRLRDGPIKKPLSVDLAKAATSLRQILLRELTAPRLPRAPERDRPFTRGLVSDLVRQGETDLARALTRQLAEDPSADKKEIVDAYWEVGDREGAVRAVASLQSDLQARTFLELAIRAGRVGRPILERGLEAAKRTPDLSQRGVALAIAVDWYSRFAPDEFDRALALVRAESHPFVRELMLQALVFAASSPNLAERVARLVVQLPAPVRVPGAVPESVKGSATPDDAQRAAAPVPPGADASDVTNALARERLVRIRLVEAALTTLVRAQGGELIQDAFAVARAEARQLEGGSQAEWLGRLGVLAARGGDFAEARRLAVEAGNPENRLTALAGIVALRAARRTPDVADRIDAELLSTLISPTQVL